jgi:hypothetical protein
MKIQVQKSLPQYISLNQNPFMQNKTKTPYPIEQENYIMQPISRPIRPIPNTSESSKPIKYAVSKNSWKLVRVVIFSKILSMEHG